MMKSILTIALGLHDYRSTLAFPGIMKQLVCSNRHRTKFCVAICFAVMGISAVCNNASAQVNSSTIAPAGLEIHWEGSLGGAGLARGEQNLVVWPHSTARREFVDVFLGNRLIERIDARQVDRVALDRLIVEGKPTTPAPILGLKGAEERAAKLVRTYGVLGKQLTVKTFNEPVIYVVALASNGILSAFDGESGELLWQTSLPRSDLQLLGPGVSDEYVTVINGNSYYAMNLKDGNLFATRRLDFTATSAPVPLRTRILVPSVGGRMVAYDIEKPLLSPVVLQAGKENRNGTATSSERDFVAWTSQESLFIVHNERLPTMWAKVNAGELVDSRPLATAAGFLFSSNNGTVIHATTSRTGSYLWRETLAMQTSRPPVISDDRVFALSDDGQVQSLDLQSGKQMWQATAKNINRILGVGKEHFYVRDSGGMLQSNRISDGKVAARTSALLQGVVPNSVNDRFFVVTRDGQLTCLREQGAVQPTMYLVQRPSKRETGTQPKQDRSNQDQQAKTQDDDPFGADPAPARTEGSDPFDPF